MRKKKEKKLRMRMKRWLKVWSKNMETTMVWNQGKLRWTQSRTSKTISTLKNKTHQKVTTNQTTPIAKKKSKKKNKMNNPPLQLHKSGNHPSKHHNQSPNKLKSNSVAS